MQFNFSNMTAEQILKIVLGLCIIAIVGLWTELLVERSDYRADLQEKDRIIQQVNERHTDYVERTSREVGEISREVKQLIETKSNNENNTFDSNRTFDNRSGAQQIARPNSGR